MAKRIAVILSQSPSADAYRRQHEEELVTQLLMEHGIDVAIIPFLRRIEQSDSAFLCLEGTSGDIVLLSWLSTQEAEEALLHLGITGRRGRTKLDGKPTSPSNERQQASTRTIYYLDLRASELISVYADEIRRIRAEISQPIVSLQGLGIPLDTKPARQAEAADEPGHDAGAAQTSTVQGANSDGQTVKQPPHDAWEVEEAELDALLDRLDDLD